jgi:hypothetical protein
MTVFCQPQKYPADDDIDVALDFVALAIDPAIPYTVAVDRIAERLRELKLPSVVSPHADGSPPGVGVSLTPRTAPGGDL